MADQELVCGSCGRELRAVGVPGPEGGVVCGVCGGLESSSARPERSEDGRGTKL